MEIIRNGRAISGFKKIRMDREATPREFEPKNTLFYWNKFHSSEVDKLC